MRWHTMTVTLMLCSMTSAMARNDRHLPRGHLIAHFVKVFTDCLAGRPGGRRFPTPALNQVNLPIASLKWMIKNIIYGCIFGKKNNLRKQTSMMVRNISFSHIFLEMRNMIRKNLQSQLAYILHTNAQKHRYDPLTYGHIRCLLRTTTHPQVKNIHKIPAYAKQHKTHGTVPAKPRNEQTHTH